MELSQQDLIKKFKIIESVSFGFSDDQTQVKRNIDSLLLRIQDVEINSQSRKFQNDGEYHTMKQVNE